MTTSEIPLLVTSTLVLLPDQIPPCMPRNITTTQSSPPSLINSVNTTGQNREKAGMTPPGCRPASASRSTLRSVPSSLCLAQFVDFVYRWQEPEQHSPQHDTTALASPVGKPYPPADESMILSHMLVPSQQPFTSHESQPQRQLQRQEVAWNENPIKQQFPAYLPDNPVMDHLLFNKMQGKEDVKQRSSWIDVQPQHQHTQSELASPISADSPWQALPGTSAGSTSTAFVHPHSQFEHHHPDTHSHSPPHMHNHYRQHSRDSAGYAATSPRSPSPRSTISSQPTMRLSPLPCGARTLEKKLRLACLFCRGRKIACRPSPSGSSDKTCK
jgi:hypothetical protein